MDTGTAPPQRILIVDDEKHLLVTLSDFLTHQGYAVDVCARAEEALPLVREAAPDLLILDISMPGLGGVGFLQRVLKDQREPPCPILVLTARANMRDFFAEMPVAGFVAKPCHSRDLLEHIRGILGQTPFREPGGQQRQNQASLLLGEDDAAVGRVLESALTDSHFRVTVATSGPAVLEEATRHPPDVLVIKRILTGMNGETVASLVRSMPRTQHLPVILYDNALGETATPRVGRHVDRLVPSNQPHDLIDALRAVQGHIRGWMPTSTAP